MTDWELVARSRGIPAEGDRLRAQVAVLTQLEEVLTAWKRKIPLDLEPAPAFQPVERLAGEKA